MLQLRFMKKLFGVLVLGLLWCSTSYANIIMQDLIDVLVETKINQEYFQETTKKRTRIKKIMF